MGIVEKIRQSQRLGIGFSLLLFGIAALMLMTFSAPSNTTAMRKAFYTVDEGQSLFVEFENKLPPFDHDGKQAVLAHVFEVNGKRTVGYLERFSAEAHRIIQEVNEAARTAKPGDKPPVALAYVDSAERNGREVKKPGDAKWFNINSPAGGEIAHPKIPGTSGNPTEVLP